MRPKLYRIAAPWPGQLAIAARPRGGDWLEDEIAALRTVGTDVLVSLLTAAEAAELGLEDEPALCRAQGIKFLSLPIEDRGVPDAAPLQLVRDLQDDLRTGRNVAVHCRQGIGRSGMLAALLLSATGMEIEEALDRVSRARGAGVPETPAQYEWVKRASGRLRGIPVG